MLKKEKKKKPKKKTYNIEGYYYDGKNAYTMVRDKNDFRKEKKIKGIIWHQNKEEISMSLNIINDQNILLWSEDLYLELLLLQV